MNVIANQTSWLANRLGSNGGKAPADSPPATPAFVSCLPADVTLARQDVQGLSMRNHLPGQVRQLVTLAEGVFVAVEVAGQTLWSEVTPEAVRELALVPGADVVCLIKTYSLRWTG